MKIDKYINDALRKFWPEDAKGERRVWFHSQNLNEDRNGNPKGLPWEGRCWLHITAKHEAHFSWHFRLKPSVSLGGVHVQSDGERGGLGLYAGFHPLKLWLTLPVPFKFWDKHRYRDTNFIDINLHTEDLCLHWQFGGSQHSWSSKTPKWKHGSFNLADFVLGKRKYTEGRDQVHKVQIPMPEGCYDATVKLGHDRWERPRWFPLVIQRAEVNVPIGIPFPGKGENDYDCGEDCSYGFTGPAHSVEDAIGKQVTYVLETRHKRGAWNHKYPPPEVRAVEVEKRRREAARDNAALLETASEVAKNTKPGKGPRA